MQTLIKFQSSLNGQTVVQGAQFVQLTQQVGCATDKVFLEPHEAIAVAHAILRKYQPTDVATSSTKPYGQTQQLTTLV
ncbi:hypothetical protein IQ266_17890 [filamentous cyanobacterium LEGE 11480]|uniref:Uncharacterized protein n=1 Tax=Romeriopsis navalis LEGE 11480 TaxID=2777977 RepID=A0A928Z5L9_9CYAN|nr:hypothetical protein [Romeriopsis navalis]MBE9031608.1 hypothetical protein [Romeriopsis navalis LEGE 11480]